MGADQASKTLASIRLRNTEVSDQEKEAVLAETRARYDAAMDPRYAAARLWVDAIIDPADTRAVVARSLECAARNPHRPEFKTGVLQT
jgi:acetyl-CoA carboxylase carboxyltransferase component